MKLATQISLGFLIAISIDLLDSSVNYTLTLRVRKNLNFVDRSDDVIRNSNILNKGIVDMQSAFRGFLTTGDTPFLAPYYRGVRDLPKIFAKEKTQVSLQGQTELLDSIEWLHARWIEYADGLIEAKKMEMAGGPELGRYRELLNSQFRQRVGKMYNDRIAALFRTFDDVEYNERDQRRQNLSASIDKTDSYSLFFGVLLIVMGSGIAFLLVRKISTRIGSQVRLAERISKGDFGKVKDKTHDELSSLSVSLNVMSERLSRTIGELEKKNAELNQFAYVVSHDLKAPVRGISNVVAWIEEDLSEEISPTMRKYLDFIPERIKRMEGLIDGLLEYARAGRIGAVKEEVDVHALVGEVVELIVPKGYRVEKSSLPTLVTERLPLQQVFSNLLSNAVKYTPADGAVIRVKGEELEAGYIFSVEDNGPGIKPEYHEKVFGLFQTLRDKEDKESTGIGLAIVRKIVEERGGKIRVVSAAGSGAKFIFTWPKDTR